jgi:hypothetical protein
LTCPTESRNAHERWGSIQQNLADFEAARRRPLSQRMGIFFRTYKPVMDDAPFRAFESTADYRRWCKRESTIVVGLWNRCGRQQPVVDLDGGYDAAPGVD